MTKFYIYTTVGAAYFFAAFNIIILLDYYVW